MKVAAGPDSTLSNGEVIRQRKEKKSWRIFANLVTKTKTTMNHETEQVDKKYKESGGYRFVSERRIKSTENGESMERDVRIETPDGRDIRTLDQAFNHFVERSNG